jgi:hypothetical protein
MGALDADFLGAAFLAAGFFVAAILLTLLRLTRLGQGYRNSLLAALDNRAFLTAGMKHARFELVHNLADFA